MRQASPKRTEKSSFQQQFNQRMREGSFIISVAVALFFITSLITYHLSDPGWSRTAATDSVTNSGGQLGAWISDLLLYLLGYFAYLIPVMIGIGAWKAIRLGNEPFQWNSKAAVLHGFGLILFLLSGTGLASLFLPISESYLPLSAGGMLGTLVAGSLSHILSIVGTSLLLLGCALSGLTLFSGFSWLKFIDDVGVFTIKFIQFLHVGSKQLQEWVSQAIKKWHENRIKRARKPIIEVSRNDNTTDSILSDPSSSNSPRVRSTAPRIRTPKIDTNAPAEIKLSTRAEKERQGDLFGVGENHGLPSLALLDPPKHVSGQGYSPETLEFMSREVEQRLSDFGIDVQVVAVHPGPVITRFELQLAPGVKVSKISNLAKDLARSLSVISVRVVEVIPGKSVVGLEVPNEHRETVFLNEVLSSSQYEQARSPLSLALGKDIAGHPVIVDLAKMPHLLVAGTTGSGKSVGINAMLLSMLFKASPAEIRLILIDPKMLELSIYEGVPHLLAPVVTDMKDAANALRWCVGEMEHRYKLMASLGVRNLAGYNSKVEKAERSGEPIPDPLWQDESEPPSVLKHLPFIVVVIDELADMMMVVGKKVEELIARIAQKARAAGIHLILATQRPSVDVITGLIKANVPTRIAFQVSSRIDSRTILDQQGAETLLGAGDMLYLPPGTGVPVRVHGAFVADHEVHKAVKDWKSRGGPNYLEDITSQSQGDTMPTLIEEEDDAESDPLYDQAVAIVVESRRASISNIQRRLKIGYNRAARMIEAMESAGVVSPMESNGSREVIAPTGPQGTDE